MTETQVMVQTLLAVAISLLAGYMIGSAVATAKAERVLQRLHVRLDSLLESHARDVRDLTDKLVGMQRAGFTAVPDEEGEVWAIDNDYELEVERKRNEAKTRSIDSLSTE